MHSGFAYGWVKKISPMIEEKADKQEGKKIWIFELIVSIRTRLH